MIGISAPAEPVNRSALNDCMLNELTEAARPLDELSAETPGFPPGLSGLLSIGGFAVEEVLVVDEDVATLTVLSS